MTIHIAFIASPGLHQDTAELIAAIDARSNTSQAELMIRIVNNFTNEILQVFFLDMTALLALSPFMEKVVAGSVNTIKSTTQTVSRKIIHKLDNTQLHPLADYMSNVMLTGTDADGVEKPYVGFPINAATHSRLTALVAHMHNGDPKTHVHELMHMLNEITDLAITAYLITPIELLKLGFILRKLAEGAITMVRGAIHLLIGKLLPDLNATQLRALARYLDNMVLHNQTV